MDTTATSVPLRTDRTLLRAAFLVDAALWLATAGISRYRALHEDGDWEVPYALFSVFLMVAAAATMCTIVIHTSKSGVHPAWRIAAIVVAVVAVVSTIIAWAFPLWAALSAFGFAALAVTGPGHARSAMWLSGAMLVGLGAAIVGVTAKLGPPGQYNDHSLAQGWALTGTCALVAFVLALLSRRTRSGPSHD